MVIIVIINSLKEGETTNFEAEEGPDCFMPINFSPLRAYLMVEGHFNSITIINFLNYLREGVA